MSKRDDDLDLLFLLAVGLTAAAVYFSIFQEDGLTALTALFTAHLVVHFRDHHQ